MADVSKNYEYMKYRMDIWYLLEAVKDCSGDVCDSFSYHPKDDWQTASLIERLECHKNSKSHKDIADGLKIALSFHLTET